MIEETNQDLETNEINREQLVQLIENDPMIKQAICKLMTQVFACDSLSQDSKKEEIEAPASTPVSPKESKTTIASELLEMVKSEADILSSWLNSDDSQEIAEARVMACAADFERISNLWDELGKKCKESQTPITEKQALLLQDVLVVFNLTLTHRRAEVVKVDIGSKFDYELHNDMGISGKIIQMQIMPGLKNPAGKLHKKPIVKLEG